MNRKFRKILAIVLSIILAISCCSVIPLSAFADGSQFTFTDFQDGISPFANNKTNANEGKIYTDGSGNKSLFVYSGESYVSAERLSGETAVHTGTVFEGDSRSFSSVINTEGNRPNKVAFKFKPIYRSSNEHVIFHPLTFAGENEKAPADKYPVMSIFFASKEASDNRHINWNPVKDGHQTAGLVTATANVVAENPEVVFTAVDSSTDPAVSQRELQFPDPVILADNEPAANDAIIDNLAWRNVEFVYDWDDANNKVTITGTLKIEGVEYGGSNIFAMREIKSIHTYTYDPALIDNYYNFGI